MLTRPTKYRACGNAESNCSQHGQDRNVNESKIQEMTIVRLMVRVKVVSEDAATVKAAAEEKAAVEEKAARMQNL
eukprot:SAG31_NODE_7795_length_1594_cov_6.555184_1_plen_75_part_00